MPLLATRWIRPAPALALRWAGADGRVEAALAERREAPAVPTVIGPRGPAGPAGPAGGAQRIDASLGATWTLPHALGRVPLVQVFLAGGEQVLTDVTADAVQIVVTFPVPTQGFVLIS